MYKKTGKSTTQVVVASSNTTDASSCYCGSEKSYKECHGAPCHCGSGRRFENCHALKTQSRSFDLEATPDASDQAVKLRTRLDVLAKARADKESKNRTHT